MEDLSKNMQDLFAKAKNESVNYPVKNIAALLGRAAVAGAATAGAVKASSFFSLSKIAIMLGSILSVVTIGLILNGAGETSHTQNASQHQVINEHIPLKQNAEQFTPVIIEENELKAAIPIQPDTIWTTSDVGVEPVEDTDEMVIANESLRSDLGSFIGVQLNISTDVSLHKGNRTSVSFGQNPELEDLVELTVQNGVLYISLKSDRKKDYQYLSNQSELVIDITMPELQSIAINGSGGVYSSEQIPSDRLNIQLNGSGDVVLDKVLPPALQISVNGSGSVSMYATGNTKKALISINGSGDVCTKSIDIEEVTVTVNGSGDVNVSCQKELNITILGSGDVCYSGSPNVSTNRLGSGEVHNCSR